MRNQEIKKNKISKFSLKNFEKYYKFSIYDITISSIFLAIYLGLIFLLKLTIFQSKLNLQFDYIFYIIFGIILGPIKGSILAIAADTLNLIIKGIIFFWMWEYAIIPPIIVIISWLFMFFYHEKSKLSLSILLVTIIAASAFLLIIFLFEINKPKSNSFIQNNQFDKTIRYFFNKFNVTIFLSSFLVIFFIFITINTILWFLTKKNIYYLLIFSTSLLFIIVVLARWIWGPIAFIKYYNLFIAQNTKNKTIFSIEDRYYFYFAPIVLKGIISIPIYNLFLISVLPIILRYNNNYQKIKSTTWY
ncbi:ECF transporter S component [[Mycoplasma] collis]|uniref:ECF transporter S component n=1 Tax=[Mycoplasma] collis TaxID=2127 RepID=UPI00051B3513|nr:ECF transporter S component [[Mycoplasma] collis]